MAAVHPSSVPDNEQSAPSELPQSLSFFSDIEPETAGEVAMAFAECPICLEDLCNRDLAPVCVLVNSQRVCRHFFHLKCLEGMQRNICPLCRRSFTSKEPLPDPFQDPDKWFELVDFNGAGTLDKREIMDIIRASLAVDDSKIPELIDKYWDSWDSDNSGTVSREEMQNMLPFLKKYLPDRQLSAAPFLPEDPEAWFDFWDRDCNGSLSKQEVAHALAKTMNASLDRAAAMVDDIWCLIDLTNSSSITIEEFKAPNGMANMLTAALAADKSQRNRVQRALSQSLTRPRVSSPPTRSHAAAHQTQLERRVRVGDRVVVDERVSTPRFNWGSVSHGMTGILLSIGLDGIAEVAFPTQSPWMCHISELRALRGGEEVTVGSTVRVNPEVVTPRYGWGLVTHSSTGRVLAINGHNVRVAFPEQDVWNGMLGELILAR